MKGHPTASKDVSDWKGVAMCTYQRPTLTAADFFEMVTGQAVLGPPETLIRHQLL
jgi:hypothetical protein